MLRQPQPQEPDEDEAALDAIIADIDEKLPRIHRLAKSGRSRGSTPPPSGGFRPGAFARTQQTLRDMRDDSLLTPSGDDICLSEAEEAEAALPALPGKVGLWRRLNGAPAPSSG